MLLKLEVAMDVLKRTFYCFDLLECISALKIDVIHEILINRICEGIIPGDLV